MCVETEAKLKVESHKKIIERLTELGAEFICEQSQKDYYFDDAQKCLTKSDKCLRLRRQTVERKENVLLTYKSARKKGKFKERDEIEVEIKDFNSAVKLLSALGYDKKLVFEKKRRVWRFGECDIALDEVPLLGNFVEIEGPDDAKITAVQEKLKLADLPHIEKSYAFMAAEKLDEKEDLKSNYET